MAGFSQSAGQLIAARAFQGLLPLIRRDNVKIDYWGATLIAVGVSVILIWVSFVDNSFAWLSWQTFVMVGAGLVLLAIAVWVESRVAEPVVPLPIVRDRTTALAHRVTSDITSKLAAAAGVPAGASSGNKSALNLAELPPAFQHIVRAAYGDATGHIFLISAAIAVVGIVAAVLMRPAALRTTVDMSRADKVETVEVDA